MREHERIHAQIASLTGLTHGEVIIVTMASLAAGVLSGVIREFRETNPHIVVKVHVLPFDAIVDALLSGAADLALAYQMPANPRMHCIATLEHRLGAVTAPAHPLNGRYQVRMAECLPYPLVAADPSMSLREVLERLVPQGESFIPVVETSAIELIKRLAQISPHITFLNLSDMGEEIGRGLIAFTPLSDACAITQTASLTQRARSMLDSPAHLIAARIEAAFDRHSAID